VTNNSWQHACQTPERADSPFNPYDRDLNLRVHISTSQELNLLLVLQTHEYIQRAVVPTELAVRVE